MLAFRALAGKGVRSKGSGTFHEGRNALERSSETLAKADRSNGTIWNDQLERSAQTAAFQCFPFPRTGTGTRWVEREMERPNRLAAEAAIRSVGMRKGAVADGRRLARSGFSSSSRMPNQAAQRAGRLKEWTSMSDESSPTMCRAASMPPLLRITHSKHAPMTRSAAACADQRVTKH